jgi:methylase of polypeptide subunit release factors
MDSLSLVTRPVHAYDLGAGVGRHALPIVDGLPTGSRVTAVDLIPGALASLAENVTERRKGARHELRSTLVKFVAAAPH